MKIKLLLLILISFSLILIPSIIPQELELINNIENFIEFEKTIINNQTSNDLICLPDSRFTDNNFLWDDRHFKATIPPCIKKFNLSYSTLKDFSLKDNFFIKDINNTADNIQLAIKTNLIYNITVGNVTTECHNDTELGEICVELPVLLSREVPKYRCWDVIRYYEEWVEYDNITSKIVGWEEYDNLTMVGWDCDWLDDDTFNCSINNIYEVLETFEFVDQECEIDGTEYIYYQATHLEERGKFVGKYIELSELGSFIELQKLSDKKLDVSLNNAERSLELAVIPIFKQLSYETPHETCVSETIYYNETYEDEEGEPYTYEGNYVNTTCYINGTDTFYYTAPFIKYGIGLGDEKLISDFSENEYVINNPSDLSKNVIYYHPFFNGTHLPEIEPRLLEGNLYYEGISEVVKSGEDYSGVMIDFENAHGYFNIIDDMEDVNDWSARNENQTIYLSTDSKEGTYGISVFENGSALDYVKKSYLGNELDLSDYESIKLWIKSNVSLSSSEVGVQWYSDGWHSSVRIPTIGTTWQFSTIDISGTQRDNISTFRIVTSGTASTNYNITIDSLQAVDSTNPTNNTFGQESGTWQIVNTTDEFGNYQYAYLQSDDPSIVTNLINDVNLTDFTYTAKIKQYEDLGSDSARLIFRATDASNHYFVLIDDDDFDIYKRVDDGSTLLAESVGFSITKTNWNYIKLDVKNDYVNGSFSTDGNSWTNVVNLSDSIYSHGLIGLGTSQSSWYFDNIRAYSLPSRSGENTTYTNYNLTSTTNPYADIEGDKKGYEIIKYYNETGGITRIYGNPCNHTDSSQVLCMPFEDILGTTAYDLSGEDNDGVITSVKHSKAVQNADRKVGEYMEFDGVNDYIFLDSITNDLTSFTVSMWVYAPSGSNAVSRVPLIGATPTNDNWWGFRGDGVDVVMKGEFKDGTFIQSTTSPMLFDQWVYLTYSYDSANMDFYFNGIKTGDSVSAIGLNNSFRKIGAGYSSVYFNGSIDEVVVYNVSKTQDEITTLYEKGKHYKTLDNSLTQKNHNYTVNHTVYDVNLDYSTDTHTIQVINSIPTSSNPWIGSYEKEPYERDLVAYFKLEGNGNDETDNDNDGTLTNFDNDEDSGHTAEGRVGTAMMFDGVDDYVKISDCSFNSTFYENDFTISVWFYDKSSVPNIMFADTCGGRRTSMQSMSSEVKVGWYSSGTGWLAKSRYISSLNKWHNLVMKKESGVMYGYLDTKELTYTSTPSSSGTVNTYIGKKTDGSEKFNGSIDEVKIFNRSLSATEIQDMYNMTYKTYTNQDLGGSANNTEDIDSDNIVYNYRWFVNDTLNATRFVDNNSLVLYLPFDYNHTFEENITYDYKRDNDGDVKEAIWNYSGKIMGGYEFDGVDDYISSSSSSNFITSENQTLTISLWFNPNSIPTTGDNRLINFHRGVGAGSTLTMHISNPNLIRYYNHFDSTTTSWTNNIIIDNWYNIALIYNGSCFQKYFNGEVDGSCDAKGLIAGGSYTFTIGTFDKTSRYFNGTIDEVLIYNRSLSALEIQQHYQAGLQQFSINRSETTKGDGWTIEVTPYDEEESGSPFNSTEIVIINSAPDIISVTWNDTTDVRTNHTVNCSIVANDEDNDVMTFFYRFYDNAVFNGSIFDSLPELNFLTPGWDRGDEVGCAGLASDSTGNSTLTLTTINITISNTPPTVSTGIINNTSPYTNEYVNCSITVNDADDDTFTFFYTWYNSSVFNGSIFESLPVLDLSTPNWNRDNDVGCLALVYDGTVNSSYFVSTINATILNTAPTTPTLISPPDESIEDSLTITMDISASTDDDSDTLFYWFNLSNTIYGSSSTDYTRPFLSEGSYYWTALSSDNSTNSSWASIYNFRIDLGETGGGGGGGTCDFGYHLENGICVKDTITDVVEDILEDKIIIREVAKFIGTFWDILTLIAVLSLGGLYIYFKKKKEKEKSEED